MGAREELTSILRDAAEAAIAGGHPVLTYEGYADAAVRAGWRPPRRVITDPAELGGVPDGTVVLDALGVPRQLAGHLWVGTSGGSLPAQQVPLPGTVLHIPQGGSIAP
jgi:hypothetical protein